MFTKTLVKMVLACVAVCALAFSTGCFSSVAGPQAEAEFTSVASKPAAAADLNQDGAVDAQDLQLFDWVMACDVVIDSQLNQEDADAIAAAFGQTGEGLAEDTNGDGVVSFSDFVLYAAVRDISERADVDGNGTWNRADRNKIQHSITPS